MAISKNLPFTLVVTEAPAQPDFFPAFDAPDQTVPQGTVAAYLLSFTAAGGFDGLIALGVTGLPDGAVATFDNNPVEIGDLATLRITTVGVMPETYNLTLTADEVV